MNWKPLFYRLHLKKLLENPEEYLEEKRIALTVLSIGISIAFCMTFLVISVFVEKKGVVYANSCWLILLCIAGVLQNKRQYLAARMLMLNTVLASLFVAVVMVGGQNLGHGSVLLLFPLVIATLLLLGHQHRRAIAFQLTAIGSFLPFWLLFSSFGTPVYQLSVGDIDTFLRVGFISCLTASLLGCLALANVNSHWEWVTGLSLMKNKALIAAIPDTIVRIAKDGTCLFVKHGKTGGKQQFLEVGVKIQDLPLCEEMITNWMIAIDQAIELNETQYIDLGMSQEGMVCYCEARVIKSGLDEVTCIIRDVTEATQHKKEMAELKEFYEMALSEITLDVVIFDTQGRFTFVSANTVKDPKLREWMIGKNGEDYCRLKGLELEFGRRRDKYTWW